MDFDGTFVFFRKINVKVLKKLHFYLSYHWEISNGDSISCAKTKTIIEAAIATIEYTF